MDPLYFEGAVGAGDFVQIFPEDVLDLIFRYLRLDQRLEAAKVCRSWRWFLFHVWRRMWQSLETERFEGFNVASYDLYAPYIRYEDVQKLSLAYYLYKNGELDDLIKRFLNNGTRRLRKLRVVSLGKLDDPLYQLIKLNGSTMRDLEFMQCTLPLSIMFNNSMKLCPNLTSFYYDVEGGSVMRGVLEDKQHWFIPDRPLDLEKLAIGQDAGYMPIYELIPWLPKLRSLSVGRSVQRPAELLQAIDRYCPDIERIVFTTARAVYGYVSKEKPAKPALKWFKIMYHDSFDEAVGIIPLLTKHYSTLEEFGVVFIQSVPSLTLRTLARLGGSNNLKTIKLGGLGEAEGATENLIAFLEASPQLEDISLDLDEIVTEGVAVALSRLQNVRTFELLRSGFLPVPALHELLKEWGRIGKLYFLIFRHNDTVYDMTLMVIASYLGCLRCLDFHDCPGITDEGLSIFSGLLHNLKHLNTFMVRDCEEVSPEVLSRTRAALEERVIMWYRYRM